VKRGLGREVLPIVKLAKAVPKSSHAAGGGRATVEQHIDSLTLENMLSNPKRMTIVDDVVTKGWKGSRRSSRCSVSTQT
jgi:hypothetical protein